MRTPPDQELPEAKPYRTKPHALGMRSGFDATRLNRLVDELETNAYLEREDPLKQGRPPTFQR